MVLVLAAVADSSRTFVGTVLLRFRLSVEGVGACEGDCLPHSRHSLSLPLIL